MKVLIVNDLANVGYTMKKYLDIKIDIIYFYKSMALSIDNDALFFGKGLLNQINTIKKLATSYDVILCMGWQAASVCYLAGVNYIMYFQDQYIDRDKRIYKKRGKILGYVLNNFYGIVLNSAVTVIGCDPNNTAILKKYHSSAEMIPVMIDKEMFKSDVMKNVLRKEKFTFLSPTRIESQKWTLDMWAAIEKTRSDFIVLQVDWGSGEYYDKVIKTKPDKVKLIEKIPRDQIASYYKTVDALLGQVSPTTCGNIEREAIMCGTPVFAYVPVNFTENDPFFKSKNADDMAKEIDKIVTESEYRKNLASKQKTWLETVFDNEAVSKRWKSVFSTIPKKPVFTVNFIYVVLIKLYVIMKKGSLKNES